MSFLRIIRGVSSRLRKMFIYQTYDSSSYWRERAKKPGQAAVLWLNQEYNGLYRERQRELVSVWLDKLPTGASVLDIGCGIGVVSRMIADLRPDLRITGVDFPEMIEVARRETVESNVLFVASSAEEYLTDGKYDLIISSACYSAIRDISKLECALSNGAAMLASGGIMLMIDPFHHWNYLARAKYASKDVHKFLSEIGLIQVEKSGILFWPFREWLANSSVYGEALRRRFLLGEQLLAQLGRHLWADYKILVYRKD